MINKIIFAGLASLSAVFWVPVSAAEGTQTVAVKLATVEEKAVGQSLSSYGYLAPDPDQLLNFSLSRPVLVDRVWVRRGQRIRRGNRLLEVITLPEARRQYQQARNAVDFAGRDLKRKKRMLADQLVTKADVDFADKTFRDAMSAVDAMRKRGFDRTREILLAPVDGIVTRLDVSPGQRVPGDTTAMLIATEKRLVARLGIEPEDLGRITPGIPVTITSVFVPDIRVNSKIRDIHAMIDPDTHLVEILVPIPDKDVDHLILGSRVTGHIRLPRHSALIVPRTAVLSDGHGGSYVFGMQNGKAKYIAVKTGVEDGDFIEVSGAIKKGDRVIISGNYEAVNGMATREAP